MARKRRAYHHGDLRRGLLDAAQEIIARRGHHALTLRDVARRAGVSPAAPYRHFPDKAALVAAVAEEGFGLLRAALEEAGAPFASDPLVRFRELGVAYVRFAVQHPARFRLMFGPELADREAHPSLAAAAWGAFSPLNDVIAACQKARTVRSGDTMELALVAWSTVHGLAALLTNDQLTGAGVGPEQAEPLARRVEDILHQGLAP